MNHYCPICGDRMIDDENAVLKTDGGEFNNEEYIIHPECDTKKTYLRVPPEFCDDWWLTSCISRGHWTGAKWEAFASSEGVPPTHLHYYGPIEVARQDWHEVKHLVPDTIKTISFAYDA
jgi:hypothetical protein